MRVMLVTGFYPGEKMGGAEYQTMLLAKGLAARGHEVVFLGVSAGRKRKKTVDGVSIWEIPGWRKTGWQTHRELIAEAFAETKPDVCYVRLLTELAAIHTVCDKVKVPVISVGCSLKETTPFLVGYDIRQAIASLRGGLAWPHFQSFIAIRKSAKHLTNLKGLTTKTQRWYPNLEIETIYNGSPTPSDDEVHTQTTGQIIWVNNLKRWKRPEAYVELARRLPAYRFVMIGGSVGGRYGRQLNTIIKNSPDNLHYLGSKPIDEVNKAIAQSDLLLYTSLPAEGFGNSFLQAWFRGVPTISYTFELDGILEREKIGRFAQTFDELVSIVDELMSNELKRLAMGKQARQYAIANHTTDKMVAAYEKLFQDVAQKHKVEVAHGAYVSEK
jgi:glycosyltransferase involved in cell wall biosynthesis